MYVAGMHAHTYLAVAVEVGPPGEGSGEPRFLARLLTPLKCGLSSRQSWHSTVSGIGKEFCLFAYLSLRKGPPRNNPGPWLRDNTLPNWAVSVRSMHGLFALHLRAVVTSVCQTHGKPHTVKIPIIMTSCSQFSYSIRYLKYTLKRHWLLFRPVHCPSQPASEREALKSDKDPPGFHEPYMQVYKIEVE